MSNYTTGFDQAGYVVVPDVFVGDQLAQLHQQVAELSVMPHDPDGVWQYREEVADGTLQVCRTENFMPYVAPLRELLMATALWDIAGELLSSKAALFKEKINYKNPGGAGFVAHQDAPAYPNVSHTVACLVAVDDFTLANGCLEVVPGGHLEDFSTNDRGCIPEDEEAAHAWHSLVVPAGSAMLFHAKLPHRSGPNASDTTRRGIYLTFHPASDGDLRQEYYATKKEALAQDDTKFSLIDHFDGTLRPATREDS